MRKPLKIYYLLFALFVANPSIAQFAPPAGFEGTTAIYADSNIFTEWATSCEIIRGYADISNHELGLASYGTVLSGIGKADNNAVSLGDGGIATLTFTNPVSNGEGWDFAVFENSFSDTFLELAFVEVSSDGENFYRFHSSSLTQDTLQVETFGETDARKINNLAGKYRAMYGVPFDMEEMIGIPGLDENHITHIRLIDVVGSIDSGYASYDGDGRIINDPWPTPFEPSGFDIDAIGVINNSTNNGTSLNKEISSLLISPNPAKNFISLDSDIDYSKIYVVNIRGKVIKEKVGEKVERINISDINAGIYLIYAESEHNIVIGKLIKLD